MHMGLWLFEFMKLTLPTFLLQGDHHRLTVMCKCRSLCALPWRRWSRSEVFEVTEGVRSSADDSSSSSPGKRSSVI